MIRYSLSFDPIPEPLIYMMVIGLYTIAVHVYAVLVNYTMFMVQNISKIKKNQNGVYH